MCLVEFHGSFLQIELTAQYGGSFFGDPSRTHTHTHETMRVEITSQSGATCKNPSTKGAQLSTQKGSVAPRADLADSKSVYSLHNSSFNLSALRLPRLLLPRTLLLFALRFDIIIAFVSHLIDFLLLL